MRRIYGYDDKFSAFWSAILEWWVHSDSTLPPSEYREISLWFMNFCLLLPLPRTDGQLVTPYLFSLKLANELTESLWTKSQLMRQFFFNNFSSLLLIFIILSNFIRRLVNFYRLIHHVRFGLLYTINFGLQSYIQFAWLSRKILEISSRNS